MNDKPLVTICITTYNRSSLLSRAIESAVNQSYGNTEIIVVDDASSDETSKIVKEYIRSYNNINYIQHKQNRGLAAARNTGWKNAKGKYVAFLDDDDEWKHDSISKRVDIYEASLDRKKHKVGVVNSGCETVNIDTNKSNFRIPFIIGNIKEEIKKQKMRANIPTIPSTGLHLKQVLEHIGGFDENLSSFIDHDLWMNLAVHNYYSLSTPEMMTVIYVYNKKESMVSNVFQRIEGIDKFISKWHREFVQMWGIKDALMWEDKYRIKILGVLAARALFTKNICQCAMIIKYIVIKNANLTSYFYMIYRLLRNVVRQMIIQFDHST